MSVAIETVVGEIKKVKAKIKKVETKIEEVEAKIEEVGEEIENETDADEKKALHKKKEQLHKKEEQLRDEKIILLQQQLQQQQQPNDPPREQPEPMLRFRSLLASKGITPSQPVMMQLVKNFASSVAIVSDAEIAKALYYSASRIPRSATEIVLKEQGIAVAQPFQASDPSKAILLHAFRDGYPMILKVSSTTSIKHEADVISDMMNIDGCDLSEKHLCPIENVQFKSASIELTDTSGSISTPLPQVRQGLLMKHYQTTLAQCKIPLTAGVLLRYGNQLKVAISHMHQMGYCHLDIKPANVFLWENNCFLGDYGAATKIGVEISECTRNYYPTDFPCRAETKTDFLLLAKTLMEMFGAIQSPVAPMSSKEIMEAVGNIEDESVKDFLHACFEDDQAMV